jgi:hypothetical protein
MIWHQITPLTFLWWNTGLTPPISKKSHRVADRPFAADQIKCFRAKLRFEILGLAEVSTQDIEFILEQIGDPALGVVDRTDHTKKIKFDIALIYDRDALEFISASTLIDRVGKRTLKLGERVTFATRATGDILHIIASHWTSRLSVGQFDSTRAEYGAMLRKSVDEVRRENSDPYIVLMGDYNDDPFSPSLAEHLLATRDRELAKRNSAFLYNPFWRRIGESHSLPTSGEVESVCGTHFYASGEFTEWGAPGDRQGVGGASPPR